MGARRILRGAAGAILAASLTACGGGGGGGSGSAAGPGPSPSPTPGASVVVVRESSPSGWGSLSTLCPSGGTSTGAQGFLAGPGSPPRGAGSYAFVIGTDADSLEAIGQRGFAATSLGALTALSYGVWVESPGGEPGLAPYMTLTVDLDGDGVWEAAVDDLLVFAPGASGTVVRQAWQTWDALAGTWCAASGACGSLAAYRTANPGARLVDGGLGTVSIGAGCGVFAWEGFEGAIDAVTIGVSGAVTVYDFEP